MTTPLTADCILGYPLSMIHASHVLTFTKCTLSEQLSGITLATLLTVVWSLRSCLTRHSN
eukprot:6265924-Amphidinium_carterae.1